MKCLDGISLHTFKLLAAMEKEGASMVSSDYMKQNSFEHSIALQACLIYLPRPLLVITL